MMDAHEPRDVDAVIDDVARAMTSVELSRDLRPAVTSRIARPSWTFGWRSSLAAAGIAAIALAAVVTQWRPTPPRSRPVADLAAPRRPAVAPLSDPLVPDVPVTHRARATVARQTIGGPATAEGTVEITPVAIVPLEPGDTVTGAQAPVDIAPIEVEPVRISQLELVE